MNFAADQFREDAVPSGSATPPLAVRSGLFPPTLLQYWHVVVRRRWVILGIVVGCLALGLVVTLLMSPKYTARAQLEVSREQKQITKVEGIESSEAGRDLEFYATQYALLRARPVAERVVQVLHLDRDNDFFAAHGVDLDALSLKAPAASERIQRERREKLATDLLLANVSIDPIRSSRLIDVNYTSRSPEMSFKIANAWTQAFIATSMNRQVASSADARQFLEKRLATLRDRLEQSERQTVNYATDRGIVTIEQGRDADGRTQVSRTLAASDLGDLNAALNKAVTDRITAQSRMVASGAQTQESIGSTALSGLRQRRAETAGEYQQLLIQFEPGYPPARALAAQLKTLDAAIAQETARIADTRTREYEQASQREAQLRDQVGILRNQLRVQQRASIQWNIYQREADTNRQLYDALLQRYKEIGVADTIGASNISVVEPAQLPERPSSPRLLLNMAAALLLGSILAGIVAFALEQIDEGVREPSQVEPLLGLPLLGSTPVVDGHLPGQLADTKSHLYDAYFSIRSNLAFATNHGFPRTLAVTSTRPAEGKSSTSLALAYILARTGKRVLLVDADMRSPSIHSLVNVANEQGLSNYLAGQDDWHGLVQDAAFNGVAVMPAGPVPPSAAELLSGERLQMLLDAALVAFDHVVIDSPPVLGLTDAPIIAAAVEGCVFVVQSEGVAVRGAQASIARLQMVQAHLFGVVLTKLKQRRAGYGGYGYSYNYGDQPRSDD